MRTHIRQINTSGSMGPGLSALPPVKSDSEGFEVGPTAEFRHACD